LNIGYLKKLNGFLVFIYEDGEFEFFFSCFGSFRVWIHIGCSNYPSSWD